VPKPITTNAKLVINSAKNRNIVGRTAWAVKSNAEVLTLPQNSEEKVADEPPVNGESSNHLFSDSLFSENAKSERAPRLNNSQFPLLTSVSKSKSNVTSSKKSIVARIVPSNKTQKGL
jgi:hypothetical protein